MLLILSFAIAAAALLGLLMWVRSRRAHLATWSRQGIGGPPPNLLLGNLPDYMWAGSPQKAQQAWMERYTPSRSSHQGTVGFFLGAMPTLVTTDLDLIRAVFIKDFDSFVDRQRIVPDGNPMNEQDGNHSLIFCPAARWKDMRDAMNKSFTTAKLKDNVPFINSAIEILLSKMAIAARSERDVEMKTTFGRFTADVIVRCAFGLDDQSLQRPGRASLSDSAQHDILMAIDTAAGTELKDPFLVAAIIFPGASRLWKILSSVTYQMISLITKKPFRWLPIGYISRYLQRVIAMRDFQNEILKQQNNNNGQKSAIRQDILQSMMDSRDQLTNWEVSVNSAVIYAAGYETTSTTLAFLTHYMTNRPDLQDRVRREVLELEKSAGKLEYNTVGELPFLEACVKETHRIHPPVTQFISRDALVDYRYTPPTNGVGTTPAFTIPKRSTVVTAIQQLHMDPAYWDAPEEFRPERFLPDPVTGDKPQINPLAFMPFGIGPRYCIGQRFAMLNVKLTFAKLMAAFRLVLCDKSERGQIQIDAKNFVQHPAHGVWARVECLKD